MSDTLTAVKPESPVRRGGVFRASAKPGQPP